LERDSGAEKDSVPSWDRGIISAMRREREGGHDMIFRSKGGGGGGGKRSGIGRKKRYAMFTLGGGGGMMAKSERSPSATPARERKGSIVLVDIVQKGSFLFEKKRLSDKGEFLRLGLWRGGAGYIRDR